MHGIRPAADLTQVDDDFEQFLRDQAVAEAEYDARYEQHLIEQAEAGGGYWLHLQELAEREAGGPQLEEREAAGGAPIIGGRPRPDLTQVDDNFAKFLAFEAGEDFAKF